MSRHPGERKGAIDWPLVFAGAGAAVTVAVVLSSLGAAGTLVGAALGSVTATVTTALYKRGIETSHRKAAAQAAALFRAGFAQQAAEAGDVAADSVDLMVPAPSPEAPQRWALPWGRLLVMAAAVFLFALVTISAVELLAGRSISAMFGGDNTRGTTVVEVFHKGGHQPAPAPPTVTTTVTVQPTPTLSTPVSTPKPSTTLTPSEPPSPTTGSPTTSTAAASPTSQATP
ncbi:hypothetical protein [Nocardioides montaniterrae]